MRFVIVTGMSGAGKQTTMKMLEDMGFYCVDNLPLPLFDRFVELVVRPGGEITKVALGLDVRADQDFDEAELALQRMRDKGISFEVIFMDADDAVLIKRYKETRRIHPVSGGGSLEEGIHRERQILQNVKKRADYVFDTSNLLTRVLKEELDRIFRQNQEYSSLIVRVVSFGFKYGIPMDADLVFDVRFLPNPYYIDELKYQTGNDAPVHDYVMSFPEAGEFLQKLTDMLQFLIPNYIKEGKHQLVIAVGCTGGKHRSVTLANELYESLHKQGNYGITITHRDEKL
ncbi:MAG: RNase adapter RapZ [Lachnospiraceae bacterium]|nr:RNase adapter RapZ [Lachnospiraceae bacterium]MBO6208862.1 RNase adapter RapZ [Lachnospiraceae bacterium]